MRRELNSRSNWWFERMAKAAMDRTYYAGIERGERNPSVKNLAKITGALGVPIGTLFDDESPPAG